VGIKIVSSAANSDTDTKAECDGTLSAGRFALLLRTCQVPCSSPETIYSFFFVVLESPSTLIQEEYIIVGHGRSFPHPFLFSVNAAVDYCGRGFESRRGHGCFSLACVVRYRSLRWVDPLSRGILPCVCR
jgi:hypothetical protein